MARPKVIPDYDVITTSKGEELHIYTPPMEIINGITPGRSRPEVPRVTMQTAAGEQTRYAKEGDPEWEAYQEDVRSWTTERDALQNAATLVTALRDYKYPNPLVFPDHVQMLVDCGALELPKNPLLLKEKWLKSGPMESQMDEMEVEFAIQKRQGIPEEVIDQMKANFRRTLYGSLAEGVGKETEAREAGDDSEGEDVLPDSERSIGSGLSGSDFQTGPVHASVDSSDSGGDDTVEDSG